MRRSRRTAAAVGVCAGMLLLGGAGAQSPTAAPGGGAAPSQGSGQGSGQEQQAGRRGQFAGMSRVMGEVTAVAGGTLRLKTEDGSTAQVVTTENTRVMKEGGPVKVSDLHPGDGVMAAGNLDPATKTLHAAVIFAQDAAQLKALRDNLGKTYITGRVTAVDLDNAKMTVERADHVAQTIGFDETTSFKRAVRGGGGSGNGGPGASGGMGEGNGGAGRGPGGGGFSGGGMGMGGMALGGGIDRAFSNGESITLADIKVGDYVAGTGAVKGGTFVPVHLVDSPPGQRRARSGAGPGGTATPGAAATPAAAGAPAPQGPGER